ncbi:MAG: DNA-binding protein [Candidatus Methanodesulfokora sp.]
MICSIDTCFLIDWSKYSGRDLLKRLFDYGFVVDEVLEEVKSENTLAYLSSLLAEGFLVIYPFKREIEPIVRAVVDTSARDPRVRTLDPPEAYALAIGIREVAVVLTENRGVMNIVRLYPEFSATVWRSYEILRRGYELTFISNFEEELRRYERETGHRFQKAIGR